ncbi:MAG: hypothetical protein WCL02_00170 [bacterium]
MIIRIFTSDLMIQDQLTALAQAALSSAKVEGEVVLVSPEENRNIYHLEIDPSIIIDDQLVIEEFIPSVEELSQVITMQSEGGHHHGECCGG